MKLGRTGAGGLPRKVSAILLSAAMLIAGLSLAADNSIYIDQAGDGATVSVTQDGTSNVVRGIQTGAGAGNTTPARIYGDGNQVSVSQVGQNNTLSFGIRTTTAQGATGGNTFSYNVTGNNATAIINSNDDGQGTSASNTVAITQAGNYATAMVNVLGSQNTVTANTAGGSYNAVTATVNGDNNTQTINVTGGGNNAISVVQGDAANMSVIQGVSTLTPTTSTNSMASVTVAGASNTIGINQSGGGNNGHQATIDLSGSSTSIGINQSGTAADNIVNLKSTAGSSGGNTFTINQIAR